MLDLFAGEQADQPDLEALATAWRDHGIHLVPRGGGPAMTFVAGDLAGDPDAPAFELLRLAHIGQLALRGAAVAPTRDLADFRASARWADLGFTDLMKGRG